MEEVIKKLQGLVADVCADGIDEKRVEELSEKLLSILTEFTPRESTNPEHVATNSQIEECAVSLWNFAVARKTSGLLNATLNARLRHISCNLVFMCNSSTVDVNSLKKQTMMGLKTARAWLDANDAGMAENPLTMAAECLEKQKKLLSDKVLNNVAGPGGDNAVSDANKEREEIDLDFFKMYCYKAEAANCLNQYEQAITHLHSAKELLVKGGNASHLAMLAYNMGVDCFQTKNYEYAVTWLKQSFEIGQEKGTVTGKNQARTLRLLANAYMEWDSQHWQKALNAVGLANAEFLHPAGIFLKLRIMLQGDCPEDRLKGSLDEILSHSDLSVDLVLNAVRLLLDKGKKSIALEGLNQLKKRCENSKDYGKVTLSQLEILLQCGEKSEAESIAEQAINDHYRGHQLELDIRKRFHLLMWEQAADYFESKQYSEAINWYNYSLSVFSSDVEDIKNLSKLHRNRASCYIGLNELEKAQEAVLEAEKHDSTSPYTSYVKYKIALMQGKDEEAISAMQTMSEQLENGSDSSLRHGLICMAAQLAFDSSNQTVSLKALESVIQHSQNQQQVLTALRCIIRLKLSFSEQRNTDLPDFKELLIYLKQAHSMFEMLTRSEELTAVNVQNEVTWFVKIAWNLALKCDDAYKDMNEFLMLCYQLLCFMAEDNSVLTRQKTCLLMAAACNLQIAKFETDAVEKEKSYRTCLDHVKKCQAVINKMKTSPMYHPDETTPVLLLLYEFESCCKLPDTNVEALLEKAISLPTSEPKLFETLAALSLESPSPKVRLSIRALKIAVKKYLQMEVIDYSQFSKTLHSLIQMALDSGGNTDLASREEAWGYYMDVVEIIEKRAKGKYPEIEIVWLMTKAWNCGIHMYSATKYTEAKRWCELSIGLLSHLSPALKENYQSQMTTVYSEVLAKMDVQTHEV